MTEDLYKTLGVDKAASQTEIKSAYRGKAKEYHPDKNPGDKKAEDMFKQISHAYDILSDVKKKKMYDNGGHDALNGRQQTHSNVNEMFREMARQQNQQREKAQHSIVVNTEITLEEVFSGVTKKFNYNRQVKCKSCDGLGGTEPSICGGCQGSGRKIKVTSTQFGHMQEIGKCNDCNGKGTTFKVNCKPCRGAGHVSSREEISVDMPHSVGSGMMFEQVNGGHEMPNGGFGDLIIKVYVKEHPIYTLHHDFGLISDIKIPYETLMLGGNVEFKTIDGAKISLTIKKLSKVGAKVKLTGKGLKKPNWNHVRGDQYLVLGVDIPNSIGKEEEELLEKLKKLKE